MESEHQANGQLTHPSTRITRRINVVLQIAGPGDSTNRIRGIYCSSWYGKGRPVKRIVELHAHPKTNPLVNSNVLR